jgi:hypothetical protein
MNISTHRKHSARLGAPRMSRAERQASIEKAYGSLYVQVSGIVRDADPIGLIAVGAPKDEYDVEVGTILPRLREASRADEVERIVYEEFSHWFGVDIAGPRETYAAVSNEIWKAWQSAAGTDKVAADPGRRADTP